jgi:hypothetical protein
MSQIYWQLFFLFFLLKVSNGQPQKSKMWEFGRNLTVHWIFLQNDNDGKENDQKELAENVICPPASNNYWMVKMEHFSTVISIHSFGHNSIRM